VFVAFDTSGLGPIVKAARKLFPNVRLIIAGDNDSLKTDAGRIAADKAASQDTNTSVIIPKVPGDWNDLAQSQGLEAVKAALEPLGEVKRARSQRFSDLSSTPPEWIIHGVIPKDALIIMFGPSGGGKSFVALDMAFHIALGRPWQGSEIVRKGPVYYICGEGSNGIRRRGDAWAAYHRTDMTDIEFYKTTSAVPLSDPEELQATIDDVNSIGGVQLVQIDTLNRNFGAGDENSTEDMTAFIQACDRIRVECRCSVQVVHHTGLASSDRARGSSALRAAADVEIALSAEAGSDGFGLVGKKMKDGPDIPMMKFNLIPIVLGIDERGQDYTSCVIERDGDATPELDKKMLKMGKNQTTVYAAAKALTKTIKGNLGDEAVAQFLPKDLYESMPEKGRLIMPRFREALNALVDRELISFDAPFYQIEGN